MAANDKDSESIGPTHTSQTVHWEPAAERQYCDVCRLGQSSAKNGHLVNIRVVERSAAGGCRACAGIQKFVKTLLVGETVKGIHFCPIPDLGSPDYDLRPYFVVYCKDRKFNCEFFSASGTPRWTAIEQPQQAELVRGPCHDPTNDDTIRRYIQYRGALYP